MNRELKVYGSANVETQEKMSRYVPLWERIREIYRIGGINMSFEEICCGQAPEEMRPLSVAEIRASVFGADRVEETADGLRFHRFTPEQEEIWRQHSDNFFKKSQCPAGVRLEFQTDSREIWLEIEVSKGTTENYFSLEVYRNGEWMGCISDDKNVDGIYQKRITVHSGMKTVRLDLPWSVNMTLHGLYVLRDRQVVPAERKKRKVIFLGDSITQGYLAHNTSFTFPSLMTDALRDFEGFNKGLGGACFDPRLGSCRDPFRPALVFSMYGTNNWAHTDREEFDRNCPAFFRELERSYPDSLRYAIVPLWRKDEDMETPCGNYRQFCDDIAGYAEQYGSKVIRGDEIWPHCPELFGDYRLHPNDRGFAILAGVISQRIFEDGLITDIRDGNDKNDK